MQFFYREILQCELEIRTHEHARRVLADWSRLKIPPTQVIQYQALAKQYVGATVDDITLTEDGKSYLINGKEISTI